MFEKSSRLKLRFDTSLGYISVEDLWDLPLTSTRAVNLDDIARSLHREIKDFAEESFVVKATAADEKLQLGFDIVKHVIDVKLAEKEETETKAANRLKKQKLLSLIAEKQDEGLKGKSVEDLQAMVEAL
jgi:hypothetical protein